jgi:hypothetical protein
MELARRESDATGPYNPAAREANAPAERR